MIFNENIVSNFTAIYQVNDTVVLQCNDIQIYLSQYVYLNSTGFGLANGAQVLNGLQNLALNFYINSGFWQIVYYEISRMSILLNFKNLSN